MASGVVEEADDTELPEPIYLRLDNHTFQPDYAYFRDEEDDDDELVDEDTSLDLSAPPSESWFHGRISRQLAVSRLEAVDTTGSYLIRESEAHLGDYAISFLSASQAVHHFKIHSQCGDYYIGGRQFYSLSDLIGFYTNNSCILENESLYIPVLPPKPVPLYMQLKATSAYIKTPDRDELSVEPGDVFLLLTHINDDWVWARSQRTGDSGLIPLAIMDELKDQDSNLGKPWFHPTISKEDAMDLLMTTTRVGTFLVRLSEPGRYSLAVRTQDDKVQRFLIQKDISGYYIFGGRQFNCLDDIISRYQKEDILEGLKLDEAVPYFDRHILPHKPGVKPAPLHPRQSDNKNQPHVPSSSTGDKTGMLLLKKGKKYPVPGQWKSFYFVLKFDEHKLIFYEHENSHRAKGLLDLKQCKVYMAHPSLYGRSDCFVLRLHYLNEQYLHYMCAETVTATESWLHTLRKCMGADDLAPTSCVDVQQIRSLTLSIQDCKLAKAASNVCCLVSIDGVCVARTKVELETPCIFDESYQFESLPPYAETFSVEVEASSKGKRFTLVKDISLGRVTVHLTDLPNGQQDDQWHQLLVGTTKVSRGSIRLAARFKHEIILPYEEYKQLKDLLISDSLTSIEVLAEVCKDHHAELASTLIHILCHNDKVIPILAACLAKAVEAEDNVSTLFRASTLPTMLMDQFMKLTAITYLHSILKTPIQQIMQSQDMCELNPSALPKGTDLMQNSERLQTHLSNILGVIYNSANQCPLAMRQVFKHLQEEVVKKWPTDDTVRTRAVSGFLFLRFICPAMLKPQIFNLVNAPPSPNAERTLKLVAKGMQNLANLVEFKAKEPFMTVLNPFIQKNLVKMKQFVNDLSSMKDYSETHVQLDSDPSRDLAAVYHLCVTYEKPLEDAAKKHAELKLLSAVAAIRSAEKKYLNKKYS